MKFMKCAARTVVLVLLSAAAAASAQPAALGPRSTPNGVTWGELALLPDYCADAMGILYGDQYYNPSPRAPHWVALMGQGFWAIHHYCYALAHVRRAEEAGVSDQQRKFIYGRAIKDYLYTLNNSAPDMVLVPEILVHLGDAYLKVGEVGNADAAFAKARRIKPDYWPAYSRWVDVLIKLKLKKDAYALVRQGLAHAPDSEVLRRQFVSLGGDLSSVAAASPAASAASAATKAASAPEAAASAASAAP
jgi:tetratricopeptide (TPR) repeat protein